jgi:hypothetical protein
MCDYSLEMYGTKPAREGERYVTTRFPSGTVGLASLGDHSTPVCVQCDTQLRLENIPEELRSRLGLAASEEATFVRLDEGAWRDGVKFKNGATISLQQLSTGVEVTVTSLLETVAAQRGLALTV